MVRTTPHTVDRQTNDEEGGPATVRLSRILLRDNPRSAFIDVGEGWRMRARDTVKHTVPSIDFGSTLSSAHDLPEIVALAAADNINRLHAAVDQCLTIAISGSEEVASAMIDHAIVVSAQARDAVECYHLAASWFCRR